MKRSRFPQIVTLLGLLFLYIPILMLVLTSFNESKYGGVWGGFSLIWYKKLFQNEDVWKALRNSLFIGVSATLASTVIGTLAALALTKYKGFLQKLHYGMIYVPLIMPDILMGISLLLFFVALSFPLGLTTIFIAHTTFCISYVTMVMLARLQQFDWALIEAAEDLGADTWQMFWKVMMPLLTPGLLAGALLAFTLSIDDFVITFFVSGPGSTTLPLFVYSSLKFGSPSIINALSVLVLLITFTVLWLSQRLTTEKP